MPVIESQSTRTNGIAMQPRADVLPNGAADRPGDLATLDWVMTANDDGPSCDSRISASVSSAFRRAVRRMKAGREFGLACDVAPDDGLHALDTICDAVRQAYTRGRCTPVSSAAALQVLKQLRKIFIEEIDAVRTSLKAGELLEAMNAFDLVRDAMERDDTDRFVAALRSGDAVDLVVEIAHDMRSPLTAILMLTEMVRRGARAPDGDVAARQLGLVYSAAFGLNTLVNDVIAMARNGDRLIDRDPVPFSTSALVDSVADILRPIAEERRLTLRVTTPDSDGRLGQPIALSRVLLNLASNALKYTETGEVAISAVELSRPYVRFDVTDTGPGLPPDAMQSIFEPLGKRPSGSRGRRFSRTGLGLSICRKLLRDMGSELQVESVPDKGTRFHFELPLPVADEHAVHHGASGALIL